MRRLLPPAPVAQRKHIIVSFGGGSNSTGLLVGLHEREIRPDAIVFADTGGEKPVTYKHIMEMGLWLASVDFPPITVLRGDRWWTPKMREDGSLEAMCLRLGTLPSKAYGGSTCSVKWKVEPQDKFNEVYAREHGIRQTQIVRMIGFDAGEPKRVERALARAPTLGREYTESYPLYDWGWQRQDCIDAIKRAGIPLPGKSACFFCPSAKKHEVLNLKKSTQNCSLAPLRWSVKLSLTRATVRW